jgi:hypothetical protein
MHNDIAVVYNHPTITGEALFLSFFIMPGSNVVNNDIGKRVDHTVAGAGTYNEIVCKRDDLLQVYQNYVFAFFVFKRVYNFTSKFECVQVSPHGLDNGAENNFV